jgi:cell shape-determining protein MreC
MDIRHENERLRASITHLTALTDTLRKEAADRRQLGDFALLCEPAQVMAPDPSGRESLSLQGSFDGDYVGRPVLHVSGVVGRIVRAGPGGAQVRLLTDPGFSAAGRFARLVPGEAGRLEQKTLPTESALVEGIGKGQMAIDNLELKDVKKAEVVPGDMVVLDDPDWPGLMKSSRLGQVVSIGPQRDAPLLARVVVQPQRKLLGLENVMIMVRDDFPEDPLPAPGGERSAAAPAAAARTANGR